MLAMRRAALLAYDAETFVREMGAARWAYITTEEAIQWGC